MLIQLYRLIMMLMLVFFFVNTRRCESHGAFSVIQDNGKQSSTLKEGAINATHMSLQNAMQHNDKAKVYKRCHPDIVL